MEHIYLDLLKLMHA